MKLAEHRTLSLRKHGEIRRTKKEGKSIAGHRHRGTNAGIGIPACRILVRYWTKKNAGLCEFSPVPDLFRHRYFFSVQYRNVRMPNSPAFRHLYTQTRTRTRTRTRKHTNDVRHEHGQKHGRSSLTWSMDMDMHQDIEMDKHHGCRNADKKFSLASLVFR